MDITLRIDDDLYAQYRAEALERKVTVGDVLRGRLTQSIGLDPRDRGLIISGGRTLQLIEERLGGGDLKDGEDLLKKVTKLASIKFGHHEFKLTPGHWQELHFRAAKTGRSIEELIEEIWRRVQQDFFKYVP